MFLKLTSLHLKLQGPTMLNHLTNKSNISLHSTRRSTASYAEGDTNSGSPGRAGAARGPAGQRTRGSVPARCGSPGGSAVPLAPPPPPRKHAGQTLPRYNWSPRARLRGRPGRHSSTIRVRL